MKTKERKASKAHNNDQYQNLKHDVLENRRKIWELMSHVDTVDTRQDCTSRANTVSLQDLTQRVSKLESKAYMKSFAAESNTRTIAVLTIMLICIMGLGFLPSDVWPASEWVSKFAGIFAISCQFWLFLNVFK